jgi:hypothetical protein
LGSKTAVAASHQGRAASIEKSLWRPSQTNDGSSAPAYPVLSVMSPGQTGTAPRRRIDGADISPVHTARQARSGLGVIAIKMEGLPKVRTIISYSPRTMPTQQRVCVWECSVLLLRSEGLCALMDWQGNLAPSTALVGHDPARGRRPCFEGRTGQRLSSFLSRPVEMNGMIDVTMRIWTPEAD